MCRPRFTSRVGIYLALMDDRYPSADDHQSVHLDYPYPDAARDLNRWLPLVKWLLAIPHYVVLFVLDIAAFAAVIVAWFAILVAGAYPRGMSGFVAGVIRWNIRVTAYGHNRMPGAPGGSPCLLFTGSGWYQIYPAPGTGHRCRAKPPSAWARPQRAAGTCGQGPASTVT